MMDLYLSSDSGVDYTLFSESTLIFLLESDTTVQKSIFDKLKQQISTMIEKARAWFQKFQTDRITNHVDKVVEDRFKENPSLKKQKVRIPDNRRLIQLQEETLDELRRARTEPEINRKMEKYRKQRNKILIASAAITTTLAAALVILHKNSKDTISRLGSQNRRLHKQVEMYKDEVSELSAKNTKLKKTAANRIRELKDELNIANAKTPISRSSAKVRKNVNKMKSELETVTEDMGEKAKTARAIVNASMQVVSEGIHDSKENVVETAKVILDPKSSVIQKAGAVASGVKNQADTIVDVVSGEASKKISLKDSERRIQFLRSAQKRYAGYRKIMKDESRSKNERKQASIKAKQIQEVIRSVQQGGAIPKSKNK